MRLASRGFIIAGCWFLIGQLAAQLPIARLHWVYPAGARIGSTNELRIGGADLDEPVELRFSDPRVTALPIADAPDRFRVVVPADVPDGHLDVRFVGRFGVSNPRTFVLGHLPELTSPDTNNTPVSAPELPTDTTLNGRAQPNAHSWYRFVATSGQRLIIVIEADRLESRMVPDLAVFTPDGRELAIARRRHWLDFVAPTNGPFLLRLNDSLYRGGDAHPFRLTLETGPRVDFAIPDVLQAGITNRVTLLGRNLPDGKPSTVRGPDGVLLDQCTVEIPPPAEVSTLAHTATWRPSALGLLDSAFLWRWNVGEGRSISLPFSITRNPVHSSLRADVVPVIPPCELVGLFPARGELAGATFKATKGEVFWVELVSERLGFPSDPQAVIQRERSTRDASGSLLHAEVAELTDTDANPGDREVRLSSRDAAVRFEAPQDGTYRILVRDQFNPGEHQPRWPFRLSLRRETPGFSLVALAMPPTRTGEDRNVHVLPVALRRDQTVALKVVASRQDGFNGPIELSASHSDSGLLAAAGHIPEGASTGTLLLTATPEASGLTPLTLVGKSIVAGQELVRTARLSSVTWHIPDFNNEPAFARFDRNPTVSFIPAEQAPVSIRVGDGQPVTVASDGRLSVPLRITRHGEFQSAFNLKPAGHPSLDKAAELTLPEKATEATFELGIAEAKLPHGTHTLWLQGTVTGKYRNNPAALAQAEEALKAADQALASATPTEKPQAEERRKAAEAIRKAAEEKAKPRDVSIPVWSQPFVITVVPPTAAEVAK
jgi:hypothetical protein